MWLLSALMHSVIICPFLAMHIVRMSLPISTEKGTSSNKWDHTQSRGGSGHGCHLSNEWSVLRFIIMSCLSIYVMYAFCSFSQHAL